jgi:hypothetical protein
VPETEKEPAILTVPFFPVSVPVEMSKLLKAVLIPEPKMD